MAVARCASFVLLLFACASCKFEPGRLGPAIDDAPSDDNADGPPIDAPVDMKPPADARVCPAAPATCTAFSCASSTSCYYICGTATTGKQSYSGATGSCVNAGVGCIVTVNDQAENNCIAAATLPSFPSALVWLGYEQASNGSEPGGGWSWRCGTSTFTAGNWGMFEPNDDGSGEDCALMNAGGAWLDGGCSGTARFVCELP